MNNYLFARHTVAPFSPNFALISAIFARACARFRGLPYTSKKRLACSDSDALIIEGCLARLKQKRPDEHSLLVAHYLYGISKRKLAKARKKDEKLIRIEIQLAEGFIDGCLSMLDLTLDLDV